MFLLYSVLFLWAFWAVYVLVMGLYRAHLNRRLGRIGYALGAPWLALGYGMDVLTQYTFAVVLFFDLPARGEHLVTKRLQRYITQPWSRRAAVANWVCQHLLDPFDPTGKHC